MDILQSQQSPEPPLHIVDQYGRLLSRITINLDTSEITELNEYSLVENVPQLQSCPNHYSLFAATISGGIYDLMRRRMVDIPNQLTVARMYGSQSFLTDGGKRYDIFINNDGSYSIQELYQPLSMRIRDVFHGLMSTTLTESGQWLDSNHRAMTIAIHSPIQCERLPAIDEVLLTRGDYIVSTIGLFQCRIKIINQLTRGSGVVDIVDYSNGGDIAQTHAMLKDGRVYTRTRNSREVPIPCELPLNGEPSEHWKLNDKFNKLNQESRWVKMIEFSYNSVGIYNKRGQVFLIGRTAQGEDILIQLEIPADCFAVVESAMRVKSSRFIAKIES